MLIYLNRRKRHPSLKIQNLRESRQNAPSNDFISIEKACCYQIVQFDYPYIDNKKGTVTKPDRPHFALVLPSTTIIDGTEDGFVRVAKTTSTWQPADAIAILPNEIRSNKTITKTGYAKLNAVCSIEPGTKVEKIGVLVQSKANKIKTAIEQFSGEREFTVFYKDGTFSYPGTKTVSPPKQEVPASNSEDNKGNSEPINSSLRYRRSFRPLYEFSLNPSYIKAVIIDLI